jgi:hypothetical protein
MMADLEALAETCPQQRLIQFLRAAVFASIVPVGLAAPDARMDPTVMHQLKVKLAFASRAIAELGLYLQEDLVLPAGSVPKRLRTILRNATAERSVAEVMSDGEKSERSFLPRLRTHLTQELDAEIRSEASGLEGTAPRPSSARIRELRLDIERVDRRLAMLGAEGHTPPQPGAN